MNEVADADTIAVSVPAGHHYVEGMVCQFDPLGHGDRPSVQAVHAV